MGQVYLAEQLSLHRRVAFKLLRPDFRSTPASIERFKREAMAVAQATHAHIVGVYDAGEADGLPFIALEYVEGRTLKEFLVKKGPPELPVALGIMKQVAMALQRAGELGIVHRDIKPENILLTRKNEVKVADFGLSRSLQGDGAPLHLTQSGTVMGTPLYMSPEQVEGKPLDPRTDIYSFGVTCYYLLSGQHPFRGDSAFEVALQHVQKQPPPLAGLRPDLPAALCGVVHKMLAKDPAQRYQTGRDLLRDLTRLRESPAGPPPELSPAQTHAPTADPTTSVLAAPRPRRLFAALLAASLLAAGGAGAAFGWARQRDRDAGALASLPVTPADPAGLEECRPNKEAQTLADFAASADGKSADLGGSFIKLGQLYLDEGRLDDAGRLFARLADPTGPPSYQPLGKLGLAVVYALRSQPDRSNPLFKEVFRFGDGGRPLAELKPVLANAHWRYWIARARRYNQANGVPDRDAPPFLVTHFTTP
jgi:serine/threonine-protein kinase